MNGHGIEKKELINEKVKIIQEVDNNLTVSWTETVKCFAASVVIK
jgi:hypothetical protein